MPSKRSSQLAEAIAGRELVWFTRPFEEGHVDGYVLDVGPRYFLVAIISGGMQFDGFQCFRISDVRQLQVPGPYADFVERALKVRGERIPKKPRVSIATLDKLLISANRIFPLVTIHCEKVRPDVCYIGRIAGIADGKVKLQEIGPDATWDVAPQTYRLSEITRVDFGGDYEEALHLVGGSAIPMSIQRRWPTSKRLLKGNLKCKS